MERSKPTLDSDLIPSLCMSSLGKLLLTSSGLAKWREKTDHRFYREQSFIKETGNRQSKSRWGRLSQKQEGRTTLKTKVQIRN